MKRPALCLLMVFHLAVGRMAAQTAGQATGENPGPVKWTPEKAEPTAAADRTPHRLPTTVADPGVIPTRQAITPAGVQSVFAGQLAAIAFGADDTLYAVVAGEKGIGLFRLDWRHNLISERVNLPGSPGKSGAAFDPVSGRLLVTAVGDDEGKAEAPLQLLGFDRGGAKPIAKGFGSYTVAHVAVPAGAGSARRLAAVALTFDNEVAVFDLGTGALKGKVRTGIAPFGAAVNAESTIAYVSNLGGRVPVKGDAVAPTGYDNRVKHSKRDVADRVVIDARGIAASGTVTCVDLKTMTAVAEIPVGLHPMALAWDEGRGRLYVANSNSDTVSVIDTRANQVVDTIPLQPFERDVNGVSPQSLVLSPDGGRLYVACAGLNAVAVVKLDQARGGSRIEGLVPTGWYPCHLSLSPDGRFLAVANLLGVGAGSESGYVAATIRKQELQVQPGLNRRHVRADRGSAQVIAVPDAFQLAGYTAAVAEDNHFKLRTDRAASAAEAPRPDVAPRALPERPGEPSAIRHVVYIIKENRCYDQILGGLGKGNGDPALEHWGEDAAPNHRKLARDFVLLDNFYAGGTDSASGHQWVTQAQETDYTRLGTYAGRSYPFDGSDPLAYAHSGFIWDAVEAAHLTFQDFGEFAGLNGFTAQDRAKFFAEYKAGEKFVGRFHTVAPIASLNPHLAADYPSYGASVPDVVRARIFLRHLQEWDAKGEMPNLVMMHLPSDHTAGTSPGFSTPAACIADNDLALGQIVEGLSHSRFWSSMLVLVTEDDAQDGIDHVDGHRTIGLAIGPHIRRGAIDSTFYSQTSMLKTIERIFGLRNLSLFDLIANDMRNSFQEQPDLTPYEAVTPRQSLYDINPPAATLKGAARAAARASARMNFREPDAAPEGRLNAILWHDAKGWAVPLPTTAHAAFTSFATDEDDKDDD